MQAASAAFGGGGGARDNRSDFSAVRLTVELVLLGAKRKIASIIKATGTEAEPVNENETPLSGYFARAPGSAGAWAGGWDVGLIQTAGGLGCQELALDAWR